MIPRRIAVTLTALVLIGGALRFTALGAFPRGMYPDESVIALSGWSIAKTGTDYRETGRPPLYVTGLSARFDNRTSVLAIYGTALLHWVGIQPDPWVPRFPSAFAGTAAIVFAFLLARRIFRDDAAALVSAGVLALSPYDIFYSRMANDAGISIALVLLGLWLLLRGLDGKSWSLVLAALPLGLTAYGYMTYKLLTPLLIVLVVATHWRALRHVSRRSLAGFGALGLVVIAPSLWLHLTHWSTLMVEFETIGLAQQGGSLLDGVKGFFRFFSPQYLMSSTASLVVEAPLALVGLIALWRQRARERLLLTLLVPWFPVAAMTTELSNEASLYMRGSSVLVILPLLAGFGAIALWRWLRMQPRVLLVGAIVVCVGLAALGAARVADRWNLGDTPTCCFQRINRIDASVTSYLRTHMADGRPIVATTWSNLNWQQGLMLAYLLRLDPRVIQSDVAYKPLIGSSVKIDVLTRVGPLTICLTDDCYHPGDGRLYLITEEELPGVPGDVLVTTPNGQPYVKAVFE